MIRVNLTPADIDYEDSHGRVADFHPLRHTFISNLARAGVHPRNAQALARLRQGHPGQARQSPIPASADASADQPDDLSSEALANEDERLHPRRDHRPGQRNQEAAGAAKSSR